MSQYDLSNPPLFNVNNTTVSGSPGVVFQNRTGHYRLLFVQNLCTTGLYLKLGTGASSADFSMVLKGDTGQDAGAGGIWQEHRWVGPISVSGAGVRYMAWAIEN